MNKKSKFLLGVLFVLIFVIGISVPVNASPNGVDDLRGRWDLTWAFDGENDEMPLTLYINDLIEDPNNSTKLFASGCMRTLGSDDFAPLFLRANREVEGVYDLSILSTVISEDWEPYLIRFDGMLFANGSGVKDDDITDGRFITEFAEGNWFATHHDRRLTKCPSIDHSRLVFFADIYAHRDIAYQPPRDTTLLETHTVIVSSGMLVEFPDGREVTVENYTDIFSPDVDFVGRFRYLLNLEETPIIGQPYTFTLLDPLGDPIPGATVTDFWSGCEPEAPTNLVSDYLTDGSIKLSWNPVPYIPGEYDPSSEYPYNVYHFGVSPLEGGETEFGSHGAISSYHIIPWDYFEPDSAGFPDGSNYGQSLSELTDGWYEVTVNGTTSHTPDDEAIGFECFTYDTRETLLINKSGDLLIDQKTGVISGFVYDQFGNPLQNIRVDACTVVGEYCRSSQTNEFGFYSITGLITHEYIVQVWDQAPYVGQFYDHQLFYEYADILPVNPGDIWTDINFSLIEGGTISGNVFGEVAGQTNFLPLEGMHVNICEYINNPQICFGIETDETGYYEITGLPENIYRVFVDGQSGWIGEFYNGTDDWDYAEQVGVFPGAHINDIDFVLEQGGEITGVLTNLSGEPLANIAVDIETGGYGTCTNELGEYTLSGIPFGNYRVAAGRDFCGTHNYTEQVSDELILDPTNPSITNVHFVLLEGGSISGFVYQEGIDPQVAIGGVYVEACDYADEPTICLGDETDENGEYQITGLPSDGYRVSVWGQPGWANKFYNNTSYWHEAAEVVVTEGLVTPGIDFGLIPGGEISGLVRDEFGAPLANIGIDLDVGGFGVCTDESGFFQMVGIPFGSYNVVAGFDYCGSHPYAISLLPDIILDETTTPIFDLSFTLLEAGSISGTVIEDFSGNPLGGIQVVACFWDDSYCWDNWTAEDGSYFIGNLIPGEHYVYADGAGVWIGYTYPNPVTVVSGENIPDIDFTLEVYVP